MIVLVEAQACWRSCLGSRLGVVAVGRLLAASRLEASLMLYVCCCYYYYYCFMVCLYPTPTPTLQGAHNAIHLKRARNGG